MLRVQYSQPLNQSHAMKTLSFKLMSRNRRVAVIPSRTRLALLCATFTGLLPCVTTARDLLDYWPNFQEHQVLNSICPGKVQHWLAEQDELAGRLFFARVVDQKIPIEALISTYQELSKEQLASIRQKGMAYIRHLPPQPILRQAAEDRAWDVVTGYANRGFYFAPNRIEGKAEEPGVKEIGIPVSRSDENVELDYVMVVATDSLSGMTVPIKIVVVEEGNEKVVLAKDVRALARGLAVVQWTSRFNGVAVCRLEFLKSSVFERRKGDERSICDWFMAVGRRGRKLTGG